MNRNNFFIIFGIVILISALRFLPHLPNFAPITALAIFAGANMGFKQAAVITVVLRFVSDIFLGFFSWPLMLAVYTSHLVGVLFGFWIRTTENKRILKIAVSSFGASAIFFLVTNFAFFYSEYQHNLSGVMLAYINGLPFLKGTILGDLVYTVALFGAYALVVNTNIKNFIELCKLKLLRTQGQKLLELK